jgi:hypothetical protein
MPSTNDPLPLEVKTTNCNLPADERTRIQPWLNSMAESLRGIPQPALDLHLAQHGHEKPFSAELRLKLPGRSLFVRERSPYLDEALVRGLTRLQRKVDSFLRDANGELAEAKRRETVDETLIALPDPEEGPLADAVAAGDYRTFRRLLSSHEIWLDKRAGRWLQRSPEVEAQVGNVFLVSDVVEEVYLHAFERFLQRSRDVPLSEWLESLIEPSIRALLEDPDERDAIGRIQSWNET